MKDNLLGSEVPAFNFVVDPVSTRCYMAATHEEQAEFLDAAARFVQPTALYAVARPEYPEIVKFLGTSYDTSVLSGAEYEVFRYPLLGERLTCRGRVSDIRVLPSSKAIVNLITVENIFTDETSEVVVIERVSFMERLPPPPQPT